jgi:hypothetical protein
MQRRRVLPLILIMAAAVAVVAWSGLAGTSPSAAGTTSTLPLDDRGEQPGHAAPGGQAAPPELDTRGELDAMLGELPPRSTGTEGAQVSRVYFALVDCLGRDGGLAAWLEDRLATADPTAPATRAMIGALAGAGTREAQTALVRLLGRRAGDDAFLGLLIPTMGFAVAVGDELEGGLRAFAAGDASAVSRATADLALGTIAARTQDPARADRITRDYAAQLDGARDPDDVGGALDVLGNVATPAAATAVARYADDPRAAVRARALQALRRAPGPDAERVLAAALSDADDKVRAAAAWALGQRRASADVIAAEASALARESDPDVAAALLGALARIAVDDRSAREVIAATAHAHPVERIRAEAGAFLDDLDRADRS